MTIKTDLQTLARRVITTAECIVDDISDHETADDGHAILSQIDIAKQQLETLRQHVASQLTKAEAA